MNYLEKSVLINCPVNTVFEFHSDTNNLIKITPEFIKVDILKIDLPLKKDSRIVLSIRQYGIIRTVWKIRISDFEPFSLITDTQEDGPFRKWIHRHCFEETEGKTLMTDKIEYELPFGYLGKAANAVIVKRIIEKQFEFRHKATKDLLERKQNTLQTES